MLGRWATRDPIEYEADDVNLYRYVGNGAANWVDPLGLIGIFFDGAGQKYGNNTKIQILFDQYQGEAYYYATRFWPNNIWANIKQAHKRVCDAVCKPYHGPACNKCEPVKQVPVDIFGWSRGAVAALTLALKLKVEGCDCKVECLVVVFESKTWDEKGNLIKSCTKCERRPIVVRPVRIRFLGLIDPVATGGYQMTGTNSTTIPSNVDTAWVGLATQYTTPGGVIFVASVPEAESKFTKLTISRYDVTHETSGFDDNIARDLKAAAKAAGVPFR